jgi:hypothetical protein
MPAEILSVHLNSIPESEGDKVLWRHENPDHFSVIARHGHTYHALIKGKNTTEPVTFSAYGNMGRPRFTLIRSASEIVAEQTKEAAPWPRLLRQPLHLSRERSEPHQGDLRPLSV